MKYAKIEQEPKSKRTTTETHKLCIDLIMDETAAAAPTEAKKQRPPCADDLTETKKQRKHTSYALT